MNQTFAGADNQLHGLPCARGVKFLQCPERVAYDFIKSLAGVCEFCRTMTAFE